MLVYLRTNTNKKKLIDELLKLVKYYFIILSIFVRTG